jgi:DNA polymerase
VPSESSGAKELAEIVRAFKLALARSPYPLRLGAAGQAALKRLEVGPAALARGPEALSAVEAETAGCRRCRLCEGRTNLVFGVGNARARLMFVGEGPGREEDLRGEPFVGRAGELLTRAIEAMGLKREEVYIANVVKCRPPNNRVPEPDEMAACLPYLKAQIEAVAPEAICCLGAVAAKGLLGLAAISKVRGRWQQLGSVQVMPTFHPAYLLRNPHAKRDFWTDLKLVRDLLGIGGGK